MRSICSKTSWRWRWKKSNYDSATEHDPHKLDIFYDSRKKCYWSQNDRGGWIQLAVSDVRRWLTEKGLKPTKVKDEPLSEIDRTISRIQRSNDVDYADSLAGRKTGIYEICGKRILVTDSPKFIDPKPGDFRLLRSIIENMLGEHQSIYLYGWLKVAIESLYSYRPRTGQAFVFAGPRNCGKSLLQNLITEILGGRCAKPHRYMMRKTDFNGDLVRAEHLMIEDEPASTDLRARREFGSHIKEITANVMQSCHPKHRDAITLDPFWRLTISVNDEPENLMVLPPLDDSLEDKLIILKTHQQPMPTPSETDEERKAFMSVLRAELPAFVDFLLIW